MNTTEQFRAAMRTAGLDYAGPIIADGRLHRFKAEGDRARNSWFVLYLGPPAAGAFGCWKRGIKENFCERNGSLSQAEWDSVRRDWRAAEATRKKTEAAQMLKARQIAEWILKRTTPTTCHDYLRQKAVKAFGEVRGYRAALVLPLRSVSGDTLTLQFISPDGTKRFLIGGRVEGCFFTLCDKPDGPLVIAEGYATAASIFEATGWATVAAMNAGNLLAVAKALRSKWPDRELVMAADNDAWTDGNPGLSKASEAAKAIHARLAVPEFKDASTRPTDMNNLATLEGFETVKTQIEAASTPKESDAETFDRLAKLPLAEYDRVRDTEAKRLGIRVGTLDGEVAKGRVPEVASDPVADLLPQREPEPWPEAVDGGAVLNELSNALNRFAVFAPHAADALALFVLATYAAECFDAAPYVHLSSPEKRCGKSLVMRLLSKLCARALPAGPCSESAVFRAIAAVTPTLLIDEVDAFFAERDELRGILNVGNVRDEAHVMRTEEVLRDGKREFVPRRYSVFCPKVFAGIRKLGDKQSTRWDTLTDRCIVIPMRRKRADEKRERFRRRNFDPDPLRQQCCRWAEDHIETLTASEPVLPEQLNDRAADLWEPLLAVADLAGGHWPERARAAALALSGETEDCTPASEGALLLADIRRVFLELETDRVWSSTLCEKLAAMEERPWGEVNYGKAINANRLSRELAPYGVSSRKVRLPGEPKPKQGYLADDFADAWQRYVPASISPSSDRNSGTKAANIGDSPLFAMEHAEASSTGQNAINSNNDGACSIVPLQNAAGPGNAQDELSEAMLL